MTSSHRLPGVRAVFAELGRAPMSGDDEQQFWLEGQPKPASENDMNWTLDYIVGPDYLKAMAIPLQRGRFLSMHDDENAPLVITIDDVFARKFFPNQDPIGKRIHINGRSTSAEIVGVVGHVKQWGLDSDDRQELRSQMYLSLMQLPDEAMAQVPAGLNVVTRSEANTPALFDSIRHASDQMSREQVVYSFQTMNETISSSLATQRFSMLLLGSLRGPGAGARQRRHLRCRLLCSRRAHA